MLLVFYSGIRVSNILHSLITYLPQNKFGFVFDTSSILDLSGTRMNLCLRSLIHSLMRVEFYNSYRVSKFLAKFEYSKLNLQFTDLDVATSIYLNEMASRGIKGAEMIEKIRTLFSIDAQLIPVCEEDLPIMIKMGPKTIPYFEYLQMANSEIKIQEIIFEGIENKKPSEGLKEIANNSEYILLLPNDLILFDTMLELPGIKKILEEVPCPIFALCPITNMNPLSTKENLLLNKLGYGAVNALEFSKTLTTLVDTVIIDESQKDYKEQIQNLGFQVVIGNLAIKNKVQSFESASFLFNLFPLKETVKPSKTNVVSRFFGKLVKKKV